MSAFPYFDKETNEWKARAVFKRAVEYEALVRQVLATRPGRQPNRSGPLHVNLQFVLPRPKSAEKPERRWLCGFWLANKRPDIDKLTRTIFDAMTGIIYKDDCQIVSMAVTKRVADPGEEACVHISVDEIEQVKRAVNVELFQEPHDAHDPF